MRINPEKQTLILAGEAIPRREVAVVPGAPQVTNGSSSLALSPSVGHNRVEFTARVSAGGFPPSAANAYARTQGLSALRARTVIIDVYA